MRARRDVVVDLEELSFADSSFMLDLMMLAQRLRADGHALVLRAAQPQIATLIQLVGLDGLSGVRFASEAGSA